MSWPEGTRSLSENEPMATRNFNPIQHKAFRATWRADLGKRGPFVKGQAFIGGSAVHKTRPLLAIVGYDGHLQIRHTISGQMLWEEDLSASGVGAPYIEGDQLFIPTSNAHLIAYDLQERKIQWKVQLSGLTIAPLVVRQGMIFVTDSTNSLYALDLKGGQILWQRRRGAPKDFSLNGESRPLYHKGMIYMGFSDGMLLAYDAQSGSQVWQRDLAPQRSKFQDVDADPIIIGGILYVASTASGLYALSTQTGEIKWFQPIAGIVTMTALEGDLVLGLQHGEVGRFNPQLKRFVWRVTFGTDGAPSRVKPFPYGIMVSLSRGGLYVLDAQTGALRDQFSTGSGILSPLTVSEQGWLYVSSLNGYLYAFSPR